MRRVRIQSLRAHGLKRLVGACHVNRGGGHARQGIAHAKAQGCGKRGVFKGGKETRVVTAVRDAVSGILSRSLEEWPSGGAYYLGGCHTFSCRPGSCTLHSLPTGGAGA